MFENVLNRQKTLHYSFSKLFPMKILCIILGVLFACFAFWQRNDITQYDTNQTITYLWIMGYSLTSIITLLSALRPLPRLIFLSAMLLTFTLTVIRFPSIEWSGNVLYNENNPAANETGGLLILFVWYTVLYVRSAHNSHLTRKDKDFSC